jgi:proline dehydrogenase
MSNQSFVPNAGGNSAVRSFFEKQGMNNSLVRKYIAGVTLRDALLVVKDLQDEKLMCTLDHLGEHVAEPEHVEAAAQAYLELIRQLSVFSPDTNVSVKLTSIGLDVSEDLAWQNLLRITDEARERGGIFIRVDTEESKYITQTLAFVKEIHKNYERIGTAIQSCLRRSETDLVDLNTAGISVRLVKGAYEERANIAYEKQTDIASAYRRLMFVLLDRGTKPVVATHDPEILEIARKYIRQHNLPSDRYQFEMLLGVRHDLQTRLVKDGYPLRVYVPYGYDWYPYFSRRMAKQNSVGSVLRGLFK